MLEIGQKAPEFRGDGSTIKGIVEELKHKKVVYCSVTNIVNLGTANNKEAVPIPYNRWRIIGLLISISYSGTTVGEDPVIHFGTIADPDLYGIATFTLGAAERLIIGDYAIKNTNGILDSPALSAGSVAWTDGDPTNFNVWQNGPGCAIIKNLSGALSTGYAEGGVFIEIDMGGKW